MKWRVFRQGSMQDPMHYPQLNKPWIFTAEVEADSYVEAIAKGRDEPQEYNKVWYIANPIDEEHGDGNPEYWVDKDGVIHGEYHRRNW